MKSQKYHDTSKRHRRRRTWIVILISLVFIIGLAWLVLPGIIVKYSNRVLHDLEEYTGSVDDIDISLFRGAFVIRDIMIDKLDEDGRNDTIPFISIEAIDAKLDWHSVFRGKIAGKLKVHKPVVKYTSEIHKDEEIEEDTSDFREIFRKLVPISINRFEVVEGQVHYVDPNVKPMIDIYLSDLYINATNLTNVENKEELLPSHVTAAAGMYNGNFTMDIHLDPLNKFPTFEMETELKSMDLTKLNRFFKEYGNFEVQKGSFSMFSEFAGKEGRFGGYVKPFIKDFEIEKQKEGEELKQQIWETIVGASMKVLENPKTEKVATKIPVNGEFENAEVDSWNAIHYVLRNAFVQALRPTIENSIDVNHLKAEKKETFLEKVFGGNDEKSEDDKKAEKKDEKKKEREEKDED
jgi:hypothetical protein